jgi:outer membrane protein
MWQMKKQMKSSFALVLVFMSNVFSLNAFAAVEPLQLSTVFQRALKKNESVDIQSELHLQSQEQVKQAQGALFPTINGIASILKQETPATASNISPGEQKNVRINLVQPLFRGLREYAALRKAHKGQENADANLAQAKMQLWMDVATAYYQVLIFRSEKNNIQTSLDLNQKRLDELNRFKKIGRSRESESLALQANMAALESSMAGAEAQLAAAEGSLAWVMNREVMPDQTLVDSVKIPEELKPLTWFSEKIASRPDLKAMQLNAENSTEDVTIARGGHLPSLDLLGNYYFVRPGFLQNVSWDVQLQLTIPLFQGGVIQSQVREASSRQKQADLFHERSKRQALDQIQALYELVKGELLQSVKQKKAVELSQKNYQAEVRDYRLGLVTHLEVLQSLTSAQDNQRLADRLEYQTKSDYLRLMALANREEILQ